MTTEPETTATPEMEECLRQIMFVERQYAYEKKGIVSERRQKVINIIDTQCPSTERGDE